MSLASTNKGVYLGQGSSVGGAWLCPPGSGSLPVSGHSISDEESDSGMCNLIYFPQHVVTVNYFKDNHSSVEWMLAECWGQGSGAPPAALPGALPLLEGFRRLGETAE